MKRSTLALLAVLALPRAAAGELPPVTAEAMAIRQVAAEPNAPAVVLLKRGELWMLDESRGQISSRLHVHHRVKVLTEQGKSLGDVEVAHSSWLRLQDFHGRTVQPDGTVVPLPADAVFVRRQSRVDKVFVTAVAFPAVAVGSILDYEYDLRFDSFLLLEPWYFQERIPVLHSEIVFHIPKAVAVQAWGREHPGARLQNENEATIVGNDLRVFTRDAPSIPAEPFGFPFEDQSSRFMLLPTRAVLGQLGGDVTTLLVSWQRVCELYEQIYDEARSEDGSAKRRAREVVAGATGRRQQAAAVYRFVRDQIETEPLAGIGLNEDSHPDRVLARRRGDYAEKALLLQSMLDGVKVDSQLVWTADRQGGQVDIETPNPGWFDRVLVRAKLDDGMVFLDPTDRRLGFGLLGPQVEGMAALVHHSRKPETLTLPALPPEANRRHAKVVLTLDEAGRLSGSGTLALTGHHAWNRLQWKPTLAETAAEWKQWLEGNYPGFTVAGVEVIESVEDRRVDVSWSLAQREEEVLGDEASVVPSLPLGPQRQVFNLTSAQRRTGVLLDFVDQDEVELELSWPEGWKLDLQPRPAAVASAVGELAATITVDEAARNLRYRRRIDLRQREVVSPVGYDALRRLFAETEKHDGQLVALVRR